LGRRVEQQARCFARRRHRMTALMHGWIEVSEPGAVLVLRIGGELDLESRDPVERALRAAVVGAAAVTIDLAELTFCDSSGVATLVAAYEKAAAEGTALTIRNAQPNVRRVFEI